MLIDMEIDLGDFQKETEGEKKTGIEEEKEIEMKEVLVSQPIMKVNFNF